MPNWLRRSVREKSVMGWPSKVICPPFKSWKRMSSFTIVVLPAPVGPTMATFWPAFTVAEKSRMTRPSLSS